MIRKLYLLSMTALTALAITVLPNAFAAAELELNTEAPSAAGDSTTMPLELQAAIEEWIAANGETAGAGQEEPLAESAEAARSGWSREGYQVRCWAVASCGSHTVSCWSRGATCHSEATDYSGVYCRANGGASWARRTCY